MNSQGIRLGYSRESGQVLHYPGPGHLITVAPTRSGKGRDVLIPALLEWPYSCVVVDPKAELACVTSERRKRFGEVRYLDPYGEVGRYLKGAKPSRYNPLARLDPEAMSFGAQAEKIGDGLIWEEGESYNHWTAGARGLCGGLQMALAKHGEPHEKTLLALRSVITGEFQNGIDVFAFARAAMHSTDPVIRQKLARFTLPSIEKARESKSLGDIIQTADVQTHFLSDAALAQSLSASDFSFGDLKKRVTTVYVVLPMDFLDVCGKYFRLIVASALSELLAGGRGVPVLMMMDEFFQLGSLKAIQNAMGMAAGFGLQLWPVLQDLSQLIGLYPRTWETFLSNAGVRMFFGPRDDTTSDHVSKQCGQTERRSISKSISYQDETQQPRAAQRGPSINVSFGHHMRQLMLPHEVRALDDDEMLLFVERVNKGPIRAKRRAYFDPASGFKRGDYGRNPYVG